MSGVFQNIDPFHLPSSVWGFSILEDARHSSVLYICKSLVGGTHYAGSLKMNTALEYSTRVVQEGGRAVDVKRVLLTI
jgi:hypothetical protein